MFSFFGKVLASATWISLGCHERKIEIQSTDSASTFSKFIKLLIRIFPWFKGSCLQPLNTSATFWSVGSRGGWLVAGEPWVLRGQIFSVSRGKSAGVVQRPARLGLVLCWDFSRPRRLWCLHLLAKPRVCFFQHGFDLFGFKPFRRTCIYGLLRQLGNWADACNTPKLLN